MPTVLLIDVSLSMCRPLLDIVTGKLVTENNEYVLYKHLTALGCSKMMDHFAQHFKLEFTALIIFSSLYEVVVPFTRDYESIRKALKNLDDFDITCLQTGLMGASQHILEEWGNGTPCQILLVTDGGSGPNDSKFVKDLMSQHSHKSTQMPVPFPFPGKLNIACIAPPTDPELHRAIPIYQKLLELNGEGNLYIPEGNLSQKSVMGMFDKILSDNFTGYFGTVHCGHLYQAMTLSPPPQPYCRHHDFEVVRQSVSEKIIICGFLNVADVSSPPAFSRHLVLPQSAKVAESGIATKENVSDDETVTEDGKQPSFCVLLHGGLKRESMVALCQLGPEWYGILYSWADNKKKSNLMLSILEPGSNVIPWLGKLTNLGAIESLPKNPYADIKLPPFPLKSTEKRSYGQNCVVWVRPGGLTSDIQKILRHARKLPEKQQSFYKELNKIRKAALMYGFVDLLTGLANLLDRECRNLPISTPPDAHIQLTHAADSLKAWHKKDSKQNIVPCRSYD